MELINKAAVIAEIERRISNHNKELQHASDEDFVSSPASDEENQKLALTALIPFLDTLEVKEVDLEKEMDTLWCSLFTKNTMKRDPTNPHTFIPDPAYTKDGVKIAYTLKIDWKVDEIDADFLRKSARHFFELGLKVRRE